MTLRVVSNARFDTEFDGLPNNAKAELWRIIARLRERPFAGGLGFSVSQLRHTRRPGARVAHFGHDRFRLLFEVDGDLLILVGVGPRPGFYRRLDRLRGGGPSEK